MEILQAVTDPPAIPAMPAPEHAEVGRIFQAHHALVLRAAYRITGSATDAEDVLQTVFLRLVRRPADAPAMENVEAYLRRSAVNAALDLVRGRHDTRNVALEPYEAQLPAPAAAPDRQQEEREMRELVRRAITRLAPRAAEIFTLHYFEGRANPEIARMLDLSTASVAVTLHRARTRLQEEIRSLMGEAQ
jgi:RNA polymerase sigma-70 factor (ECF subfamily)